jgi:ferric iron reductase protein FhuF
VHLIEQAFLKNYLEEVSTKIGSPSLKVTASIFMKRYAFLSVMALYSMSAWDKKLDLSIRNIWVEEDLSDGQWFLKFSFSNMEACELDHENRDEWRKEVIRSLFADHFHYVIDALVKVTNVSKLILWENTAVYLYWLYETVLKDNEQKGIAESDFRFLFKEAGGFLFGRYNNNPLTKFDHPKSFIEEIKDFVRVRKTCCFSYKLAGSNKRCKTCPCRAISNESVCLSEEAVCNVIHDYN